MNLGNVGPKMIVATIRNKMCGGRRWMKGYINYGRNLWKH